MSRKKLTEKEQYILDFLKKTADSSGQVKIGSMTRHDWTLVIWLVRKGYLGRVPGRHKVYKILSEEDWAEVKAKVAAGAKVVEPAVRDSEGKLKQALQEVGKQKESTVMPVPKKPTKPKPKLTTKDIPEKWQPYLVDEVETYIETNDELRDTVVLLENGPVMCKGFKGIGKSLLAANIAKQWGIPRFVLSCSKATDEEDVLGRYVDLGKFVDGPVTQAVRCAQETGHAMLVLEEVNAMHSGVSFVLHNLLDFNRMLVIPATGEVLKVNGHGKLYIIAT